MGHILDGGILLTGRDTLDSSTASETADGGLGDTLFDDKSASCSIASTDRILLKCMPVKEVHIPGCCHEGSCGDASHLPCQGLCLLCHLFDEDVSEDVEQPQSYE